MKLRGHHLFCTALFSGHGYNEAFTEAMGVILRSLRAGEPMELTSGPDCVCAACPHLLEEGGCALGTEDVCRRDCRALEALDLKAGDTLTWGQAQEKLGGLTEQTFQSVCGSCRWQREGLCSFQLLRERTAVD